MKNSGINNIKQFFNNNISFIVLFIILSLLNTFFLCWSFSTNGLSFNILFAIILTISIILEIVLCLIILIAKKKNWKIEKVFLILCLIIGPLYVFALPIGRAPDEESHFFRVYELSAGHIVSDISDSGQTGSIEASNIEIIRGYVKDNVTYDEVIRNLTLYPDEENQVFVRTSAYSYNIFSYLPHVIGMTLGKIMHLPFLMTAYLAKIFNLLVCTIILYFSIKYIPFFKRIVFFLALLPITMQAMASLSPDGLAISTSIALISFILYSIYTLKNTFSKQHLAILFILCLFISMGKIAYAPLCLLLFTIPKERFGTQRKKITTILAMGATIFVVLLVWLLISPPIQSAYDSTTQISTILSNPLKYLAIIVHSISVNIPMYINGFLGGNLEWFNISLSPIYIYSALIIFVLLCNKANQFFSITKSYKILSIIVFTTIALMTFTTMFIQWTKVGELVIDGVQGRYFLPIALLVPSWFLPIKNSNRPASITLSKKIQQNYYLYEFLVFESIYAITAIACTHL